MLLLICERAQNGQIINYDNMRGTNTILQDNDDNNNKNNNKNNDKNNNKNNNNNNNNKDNSNNKNDNNNTDNDNNNNNVDIDLQKGSKWRNFGNMAGTNTTIQKQ